MKDLKEFYNSINVLNRWEHDKYKWDEVKTFLMCMDNNDKVFFVTPRQKGKTFQSLVYLTYYALKNPNSLIKVCFTSPTLSNQISDYYYLPFIQRNSWKIERKSIKLHKYTFKGYEFSNGSKVIFCSNSLDTKYINFNMVIMDECSLYKEFKFPPCSKLILTTSPRENYENSCDIRNVENSIIKSKITSNIFL